MPSPLRRLQGRCADCQDVTSLHQATRVCMVPALLLTAPSVLPSHIFARTLWLLPCAALRPSPSLTHLASAAPMLHSLECLTA